MRCQESDYFLGARCAVHVLDHFKYISHRSFLFIYYLIKVEVFGHHIGWGLDSAEDFLRGSCFLTTLTSHQSTISWSVSHELSMTSPNMAYIVWKVYALNNESAAPEHSEVGWLIYLYRNNLERQFVNLPVYVNMMHWGLCENVVVNIYRCNPKRVSTICKPLPLEHKAFDTLWCCKFESNSKRTWFNPGSSKDVQIIE